MTAPYFDTSPLLETLNGEIQAVSDFVELLKKEQSALTQGSTDELPALAEQKNQLAERLAGLASRRNAILTKQGFAADRPGMDDWCRTHPDQAGVGDAWRLVLKHAAEAKTLNHLNGDLIALRMQHNARALEALRGDQHSLSLYGPDGQSQAQNQRRINDSV